MDLFDQAQDMDARFLQQALTDQQRVSAFAMKTRVECIDCEGIIPEARRRVLPGCQRCIVCAEKYEGKGGA